MSFTSAKRHSQLLALCLALSSNVTAFGEEKKEVIDMPLDQLVNMEVVSASRYKQKSSEAPSSVEVLTAEQIRDYGWRTLADALNSIRGLYIRNDRNYTFLGNRGFSRPGDYNARVLIMIDGRRMNETIFDSGFIGEEFMLDMSLIERIEYIPGPGSSMYGANALLGVVNVITRQGRDIDGLRVGGEVGSLNTYRGKVTYGKQWNNGVELLLHGSHFVSEGNDKLFFPEFNDINGGIAQDMDDENTSRTFGKLSYGNLTLRAGYSRRFKRIPTAGFGSVFNNRNNGSLDAQGYVDLNYFHDIGDNLNMELRGYHHWYDYHAHAPYAIDESSTLNTLEKTDARWWGGEFKLIGTQFINHKWIAGIELQHDEHQHYVSYDVNPFAIHNNKVNQGWRAGFYIEDEYRINDNLMLNAGVRVDHHHFLKSWQANPRVGLIWDITPTFTTKLIYASAFRAPNILEHDLNTSLTLPPQEEKITSYEAIAEWYPGGGVKLLGNIFLNDIRKVITQEPNFNFNSLNTGRFKSLGFELGAEKRWDNGRQLKFSWSYNNTRDLHTDVNAWSTDSPRNMVKVHYTEPLIENMLNLGLEEIFVDQRRTFTNRLASGYHLFNLNLSLPKPIYGFQASLGIYNVFDQRFDIIPGINFTQDVITMDGRTARFRVEYGF